MHDMHESDPSDPRVPSGGRMSVRCAVAVLFGAGALLIAMTADGATPDSEPPTQVVQQALEDAWWTGPMLTPSAATLPRGHFLIEPYLYDVVAAGSNGFGSLTYLNYGLADRFTIGLIPTAGFTKVSGGPSSSGVGLGDLSVLAQYRLTQFRRGSWLPTTSVVVQETFPTGKFDRLGDRPSDGFGSGAYATSVALYSQTYFWLPNGRILRMRFNLSQAFSSDVSLEGASVYGTETGFNGSAKPGRGFSADASWEYSLTRSWVLALDVIYRHQGSTRVAGHDLRDPNASPDRSLVQSSSGPSDRVAFAPALEYSWKSNWGVLLGVRVIPGTRNSATSVTPAVAINFVH